MPADTTETGAEHSAMLQPSINLHAPAALVPNVLPRRDESSVEPCAVIEASYWAAPTQDKNLGGRIQNYKRWPLHYLCTPVQDNKNIKK